MTAGELGSALAPLRERYAHWLQLSPEQVLRDREEAAEDIRAMQLVLRMERQNPPSWHRAMAAAATGAAAVCLDRRGQPGGEWYDAVRDYCAGHIRKVTRRARGAHWAAAQDLPGVTVEVNGTQVRALVPGRATDLDPRISRLQVGGTDVPPDDPPEDPGYPTGTALEIWPAPEPIMTLGKAMAQAGHAGMIAAALSSETRERPPSEAPAGPDALSRWVAAGLPVLVRRVSPEQFAGLVARLADQGRAWRVDRLLAVRDAGFTEVAAGTVTVIARAPA